CWLFLVSLLRHTSRFILFFYCPIAPRCLHSFPTRRSSDLEVGNMNRSTREALMSSMDELINTDHGFQTLVVDSITSLDKLFWHRSEERRVGKECRTRRSAQE